MSHLGHHNRFDELGAPPYAWARRRVLDHAGANAPTLPAARAG